jgi:hypothetical protein
MWLSIIIQYLHLLLLAGFMVDSLNDQQKERQLRILNDKKEGSGVRIVRHRMERVIDVKDLLVLETNRERFLRLS